MTFRLALPESVGAGLTATLAAENETGCMCVARVALDAQLLLVRELLYMPDDAYLERGPRRMRIASAGFAPAFARAAQHEESVPVFFHTHPGMPARPSKLDDEVDEQLLALALTRTGRRAYASIIIGGTPEKPQVTGRFWRDGTDEPALLDRLRLAGPGLGILLAEGRTGEEPATMFDRHVRAFGRDGQRVLGALTIGVVGAGGTGSPTIEQLARLGVGKIVALDHDTVDETNLTRIHESTAADVDRLKVDVAHDRAESYGTGTVVERIPERALSRSTVQKLARCDIVFGCTDDHAGRLVLSRLAYWYLVPVIDLGVVIDAHEGHIRGVHARVTVVAPGTVCLQCRGQIDMARVAAEMMPAVERELQAREGYVPGLGDHAPAVIPFTTATSALAVTELLARLFGFGAGEAPQHLRIGLHDRSLRSGGPPAVVGHYCDDPLQWAMGDTVPPLGLAGLG